VLKSFCSNFFFHYYYYYYKIVGGLCFAIAIIGVCSSVSCKFLDLKIIFSSLNNPSMWLTASHIIFVTNNWSRFKLLFSKYPFKNLTSGYQNSIFKTFFKEKNMYPKNQQFSFQHGYIFNFLFLAIMNEPVFKSN
jgi:hypothetical protein